MCRKVKKFDYYTRCSYCKRVFCNKGYDMSRYAYTAFSNGRKLYFCRFNCMIRYEREHKQQKLRGELRNQDLLMMDYLKQDIVQRKH